MEVLIEKDEHDVLWWRINRPTKMNAINYEVMDSLEQVLNLVKKDKSVKALVITGSVSGQFCSGGDLSVFHQIKNEEEAFNMLTRMANLLIELFFLPVPTVAFIDGPAVGGGCEIAMACDFRIGTEKSSFRFAQGMLGIITGWGGTTFLAEHVGSIKGLKWLLMGKRILAEELYREQILNELVDEQGFKNWLLSLVGMSSEVIRGYKASYSQKRDKEELKIRVLRECRECARLWESDAHHHAVSRFLEKK